MARTAVYTIAYDTGDNCVDLCKIVFGSDGSYYITAPYHPANRAIVITVPDVTGRELRLWQLESGGRGHDPIVGAMSENALRLWGAKRLRPAVEKATGGRITDASTYLLRHSHASACHYVTTLTVPEICRRLGHSQQTHFLSYAHVIDAIDGERYTDLETMIETARDGFRSTRSMDRAT